MLLSGISKSSKPLQKQLFVSLDDDEQKIYDFLLKTGKELMDIIALRCDFLFIKSLRNVEYGIEGD